MAAADQVKHSFQSTAEKPARKASTYASSPDGAACLDSEQLSKGGFQSIGCLHSRRSVRMARHAAAGRGSPVTCAADLRETAVAQQCSARVSLRIW